MRIVLFALLLSAGCVAGAGYSMRDRVTAAAREYNDGVRWQKWEQAAAHIAKDTRIKFLERHQAYEDELEIADYELVAIDLDKSDKKRDRATARVDYTWTLKRQGLLQKTSTLQRWEEKEGGWMMEREERLRGAALPLFDEPAAN
jgi:hypothetical protein